MTVFRACCAFCRGSTRARSSRRPGPVGGRTPMPTRQPNARPHEATGRRVRARKGQGTLRWTGLPRMFTIQVVVSFAFVTS